MSKNLPTTLTGARRLIAPSDPALDHTDEAKLEKALAHTNATGQINGLPLKDGQRPVVWHVRSLGVRDLRALARTSAHELQKAMAEDRLRSVIVDRATFPEQCDAFALGVVAAENATDEAGRPIELEFEDRPGGKAKVLTEDTLDAILRRYFAEVIVEIGQQVIEACHLPPR